MEKIDRRIKRTQRLLQEAGALERAEVVAHGGGADVEARGYVPRRDGVRRGDVRLRDKP